MRSFILSAMVTMFLMGSAQAGSGHSHEPVTEEVASRMAIKKIDQLVEKGTIHNSWSGIKPTMAEKKPFAKGPEWVVTFSNAAVPDPSKRKLYVFFSMDGHYLATNYTGK